MKNTKHGTTIALSVVEGNKEQDLAISKMQATKCTEKTQRAQRQVFRGRVLGGIVDTFMR